VGSTGPLLAGVEHASTAASAATPTVGVRIFISTI
jgi:hypothetical protein